MRDLLDDADEIPEPVISTARDPDVIPSEEDGPPHDTWSPPDGDEPDADDDPEDAAAAAKDDARAAVAALLRRIREIAEGAASPYDGEDGPPLAHELRSLTGALRDVATAGRDALALATLPDPRAEARRLRGRNARLAAALRHRDGLVATPTGTEE